MNQATGKTVLISGGSRGTGYATAVAWAKRGANIVITARGEARLQQAHRQLEAMGAQVTSVVGDVSQYADAERMVAAALARFGCLDILINNAGVSMRGRLEELAPAMCADVLAVNLQGAVNLTRAAVASIKVQSGSIVFVSSIAGLFGLPGASVYCASKGALTGFAESLRLELAASDVHVGVVHLGFTEHDPEKRILDANGDPVLPDRPAHHTQDQAAAHIVRMIETRKRRVVLTPVGKLGAIAYRLSPAFVERAILFAQTSGWKIFRNFS